MPYLDIQIHTCSNPKCNKIYEWDCHIPDPINSPLYTVVEEKSCVHAKLQEKINYNTTHLPIATEVTIQCPYCGTIDIEQITIE